MSQNIFSRVFSSGKLRAQIFKAILFIVLLLIITILFTIEFFVQSQVEKNISNRLLKSVRSVTEIDFLRKEQILSKTEFFLQRKSFKSLMAQAQAGNSKKLKKRFKQVTNYPFLRIIRFDGRVLADSLNKKAEGKILKQDMGDILDKARSDDRALSTWEENGQIYQVVAIVLSGARQNSVLIAGRQIDDTFAYKLDEVTGNKAVFFQDGRIVGTSFQKENVKEIEAQLPEIIKYFAPKAQTENTEEATSEDESEDDDSAVTTEESSVEIAFKTTSLNVTINGNQEEFLVHLSYLIDEEDKKVGSFIIGSSKSKELEFLTTMRFIIIILGLVGLVAAFAMGMFSSGAVTRNVNQLVEDVNVVKEGNLDHEIKIDSEDEIGFLGDQFDSMRIAFKGSQAQLRDYADNLEEKVKERTAELTLAKKETDEIMNTVDQGLFLVHKDGDNYVVGSQYSAALQQILEVDDPGNKDLMKSIENLVDSKAITNTKNFLKLMFQKGTSEKMLGKLNPLRNFEANFGTDEKNKFLKFHFNRIIADDKIAHLMATVTDVTQETKLSRKLAKAEAENKRQMELLFSILQISPKVLEDFIADIEEDLDLINTTLKGKGGDTERAALLERLDLIYRSMHTIKGNSSLLNLNTIAEQAHKFEDKVGELQEKENLEPTDFLKLVLQLNDFRETMKEVKALINKLAKFQTALSDTKSDNVDLTMRSLEKTVEKLSEELNKDVSIDYSQYSSDKVPKEYRKLMKDIMVQLVRNSMIHGIETTEDRKNVGKTEQGHIVIKAEEEGDSLRIRFRDDGRGLQLDKLRNKAIESGKYTKAEVDTWKDSRVAQLIYDTGLSTAEETTMNAGRGVGMDIIKQKISDAGGSLGLSFKVGQFCEFNIVLPKGKA